MTHDKLPKSTESTSLGAKQGPEPDSEQARFMDKMRESVLSGFKATVNKEREKPQKEPNCAVSQILSGFTLEDDSQKKKQV